MSIKSITKAKMVDVYDVTMSAPNHTLVTDSGIVACNSHAVAYSEISYCDAYAKANHMKTFYVASLRMARHKTQSKIQIKKLVKEAATFDIVCKPPRLENCYVDFTEDCGQIYFGISNIKGIGEKKAQQIVDIAPGPDTWYKCLFNLLSVGKAVAANCILAGVFAKYKVPVRRQIDDLNNLSLLSIGEKKYAIEVFNNFDNFADLLRHVKVSKATTKRQDKLDSIIKLQDNVRDTTQNEVALFGCTISYDNIDTVYASGNCSVNDYNEGKDLKLYQMVVEVERAKTHEITKGASEGKLMCFLSVFDHSGKMDVTLFDTAYDEFGGLLYEGSTIMIKGKRGRRKGLIVDEVLQII
jgi:DNA polymerase III alpha subunit